MNTRTMTRGGTAVGLAVMLAALLAPPVGAAAERRAAVNGLARASAVFAPFAVNPNFDFWPVYSLSEIDTSTSHGVSAGFWPGFLVDATFFQFGYQPFERAAFGVTETLWPNPPNEADAGTHDFEKFCKSGEVSTVPLPFGMGDGGFPEPMLTGCQTMYAQYRSYVPWEVAASSSRSGEHHSDGSARGTRLAMGPVTIGNARATSSTDAAGFTRTVSEATVQLEDIAIGTDLRIGSLRSVARAVSDGTEAGTTVTHRITVADVTYQGERTVIDDEGVSIPGVGPIDEQLAANGFEVRLIGGRQEISDGTAAVEAGGLIIRMRRDSPPPELAGPMAESCDALAALQPEPITGVDQPVASNPLYEPRPPYDQTPPEVGVHESVPPAVPCPLLLMQRSLDVGVVLGGATAAARYRALPAPPDFGGEGGFGGFFPPEFGGEFPVFPGVTDTPPVLPGYSETPPVPLEDINRSTYLDLGPVAAQRVRALYAGMALLLALTLVGRRVFRSLVMP